MGESKRKQLLYLAIQFGPGFNLMCYKLSAHCDYRAKNIGRNKNELLCKMSDILGHILCRDKIHWVLSFRFRIFRRQMFAHHSKSRIWLAYVLHAFNNIKQRHKSKYQ